MHSAEILNFIAAIQTFSRYSAWIVWFAQSSYKKFHVFTLRHSPGCQQECSKTLCLQKPRGKKHACLRIAMWFVRRMEEARIHSRSIDHGTVLLGCDAMRHHELEIMSCF